MQEAHEDRKGMIVFLPGCFHSAYDFWPKQTVCMDCVGLPVEMTIASRALQRGFSIMALSPPQGGCWDYKNDMSYLKEAIDDALGKNLRSHPTPLYLFGISSGGTFASVFTETAHNDATHLVTAQCIHLGHIKGFPKHNIPPTVFVPMVRDAGLYRRNKKSVTELTKRSVHSDILPVDAVEVTASFFHDHDERISSEMSTKLYNVLCEAGLVDKRSGEVVVDPRMEDWISAVTSAFPGVDLTRDKSPVYELLNMAYGLHEISDQHVDKILDFFAEQK